MDIHCSKAANKRDLKCPFFAMSLWTGFLVDFPYWSPSSSKHQSISQLPLSVHDWVSFLVCGVQYLENCFTIAQPLGLWQIILQTLLLLARVRYCQIFIEYISAIDDKDLWYGYFCRNLIEWKRTECDNWAKEDQVVAETFGRIEQKSQIREVALLNQLVSVDQQIEGWKADHTSAGLIAQDHPDWPEADAASDFYLTDLGLSLGWTGH